MNILYFYQYFSTNNGKWGTRAYEFSKRWVKQGNQVTVFTSAYDKSDLKSKKLFYVDYFDEIKVVVVNINISNKHNIILRAFTFILYTLFSVIYALFSKHDVVISSSGPLSVAIPGLISKFIRNKKLIFEVRDIFTDGLEQLQIIKNKVFLDFLRKFENFIYKNSDCIVVLSESMKDWIRLKNGITADKINVITNASDVLTDVCASNSELPSKYRFESYKIVVYYGTIGRANNCIQIINAARILKKREINDIKIWIIGDGVEKKSLVNISLKEELLNILEFHEPVPRNILFQILKKCCCSLLILKNIEVFDTVSPNKLFDSFTVGLPIIQTTNGWIKTLVNKHKIGVNIKSGDSNSLADAIELITKDNALAAKFSSNSMSVGQLLFNRDKLALSYLKILKDVAKK